MKARIVRIGNSRGVRIPKVLIEQCHLPEEVELEVRDQGLLIRSAHKPREGWEEAFRVMAARGDDRLLDPDVVTLSSWDREEWQW